MCPEVKLLCHKVHMIHESSVYFITATLLSQEVVPIYSPPSVCQIPVSPHLPQYLVLSDFLIFANLTVMDVYYNIAFNFHIPDY